MAYSPPYIAAGLNRNPYTEALSGYQQFQQNALKSEEIALANELSRLIQPYAAQTAEESAERLYLANELSKVEMPYRQQSLEADIAQKLAGAELARKEAQYAQYKGKAGMMRYLAEQGLLGPLGGASQHISSNIPQY